MLPFVLLGGLLLVLAAGAKKKEIIVEEEKKEVLELSKKVKIRAGELERDAFELMKEAHGQGLDVWVSEGFEDPLVQPKSIWVTNPGDEPDEKGYELLIRASEIWPKKEELLIPTIISLER